MNTYVLSAKSRPSGLQPARNGPSQDLIYGRAQCVQMQLYGRYTIKSRNIRLNLKGIIFCWSGRTVHFRGVKGSFSEIQRAGSVPRRGSREGAPPPLRLADTEGYGGLQSDKTVSDIEIELLL